MPVVLSVLRYELEIRILFNDLSQLWTLDHQVARSSTPQTDTSSGFFTAGLRAYFLLN